MKNYVSAGIIPYRQGRNQEKEYLLLKYAAGHWDFPKGKVEPGESLVNAAVRELHEETGLNVQLDQRFNYSFSYEFDDYDGQKAHKEVTLFVGLAKGQDMITLSAEHQQSKWLPYEQALQQLTHANARDALQQVEGYLKRSGPA